ncbi:disease resistance protein RGA2-like [Miscanthus floridulus]|uniref:disease resistance protein RGA2-like n=1 Tax=Miscanthus floridulus TaxID=154761 RepID=UPI003458EC8B
MEAALSAFLGEITNRSMSFFIAKLSKDKAEAASLPSDEDLRRKLLRVGIIVEEAHGRQIRSQAMLEQLKILQAGMFRGQYALDAFKYDPAAHQQAKDDNVSHYSSFAISKLNPAKRIQLRRSSSGGRSSSQFGEKKLRQVLGSLEIVITDAAEFVVFLKGCPPLYRCLYSTYLNLENCMFDRHVEMEHIINFVLAQKYPPAGCSTEDHHPDVLPIVGPPKSGKSTLLEYVCNDERVRRAFYRIVFFAEDDLDERIATHVRGGGSRVKYHRHASERGSKSVLVIVEVNGDISEASWSRLIRCSASTRFATSTTNVVTKIIICSRSNKIMRLGTTRALKIGYLTQEAYWYFFKALAFGSMHPEEEPELASLAMEIATCLKGSFIAGNAIARMLRDNLSAKFWRMALSCFKEVNKRYPFLLDAHPVISPSQDRKLLPMLFPLLNGSKEYCTIFNGYQIVSAQDEAPMITVPDVLLGRDVLRGKSDVLAWRSTIPPYCSYTLSCEIHVVS